MFVWILAKGICEVKYLNFKAIKMSYNLHQKLSGLYNTLMNTIHRVLYFCTHFFVRKCFCTKKIDMTSLFLNIGEPSQV